MDGEIHDLVHSFLSQMRDVPKIQICGTKAYLKKRRRLFAEPSFVYVGDEKGNGWFVATPAHPGAVTHVDTSAAQTEYIEQLGLAIADDGRIWAASPPTDTQIIVYGDEIGYDRDAMATHTHGKHGAAGVRAQVLDRLADLLAAAVVSPASRRALRSRREMKQLEKDTVRYRDEKIYGPGGRQAYEKRKYGK